MLVVVVKSWGEKGSDEEGWCRPGAIELGWMACRVWFGLVGGVQTAEEAALALFNRRRGEEEIGASSTALVLTGTSKGLRVSRPHQPASQSL